MSLICRRIEEVGKKLIAAFDEADFIPCPECGNQHLQISKFQDHFIFECSAPIEHECPQGGQYCIVPCGFKQIVRPTNISQLPSFTRRRRSKKVRSEDTA